MDMAAIEYRRRPTEYKIDRTFYITVLIILPHSFSVGVERILKTEETAVLKISAVGADKTGNRLSYRTGCIFKCNILRIKVGCIDIAGRRTGRTFIFTKNVRLAGIIVV